MSSRGHSPRSLDAISSGPSGVIGRRDLASFADAWPHTDEARA
jgi:hypothetical protein